VWNEFVGLFALFQKCQTLLALWYAAFRVGIPVWILTLRVSFSGNCYCFQIGRQHGITKGLQILVLDSPYMSLCLVERLSWAWLPGVG